MNTAVAARTSSTLARREIAPLGNSRVAVRGLRASMWRSAIRLKPIAAVRAPTMASTMATTWAAEMPCERAARVAAASAKGSAKTVWLNLIMRANTVTLARAGGGGVGTRCPVVGVVVALMRVGWDRGAR